jgi:hypothetical protein
VPHNQLIQLHIAVCCATQPINTVTYSRMLCLTFNTVTYSRMLYHTINTVTYSRMLYHKINIYMPNTLTLISVLPQTLQISVPYYHHNTHPFFSQTTTNYLFLHHKLNCHTYLLHGAESFLRS